jgi:ABC-type branched-subunit amino acid transport system substrate-binding protein
MRALLSGRTILAGTFVLALLASACSGNKPATNVAANGPDATASAPESPGAKTAVKSTGGTSSSSGGTTSSVGGGGAGSSPTRNVAGTKQVTKSGFTYKAANLFTPSRDRIGISAKQITLCMHAALVLGPAFSDSEKDFQVYWQWLNGQGGIFGRQVKMVFTDDAYTPTGGVQAAQQCYSNNPQPFLMMAGVGFDTVPAVRQWAEQNKELYLASFATEHGLYNLKYTFEYPPSVEHFGDVAGKYVKTKFPGGSVGVVWRNSPNWQGGRDSFENEVKSRGAKVTDLPVSQNQGSYTNEILQLKAAKATTVLAWVNVLEFAQLEKQAAQQSYYPRWVGAGFNLVTDTVGADINGSHGPPAIGLWVTPEYHNGDTTSPWSGEEQKMRAAYAKYDSGHTVTDTDWQAWLAFKQTTQMFVDCGQDCTRNKIAGMMLSGYKANVAPLCAVDFARGRGKIGSFGFNVWKAVSRGGGSGWQQIETCKESF